MKRSTCILTVGAFAIAVLISGETWGRGMGGFHGGAPAGGGFHGTGFGAAPAMGGAPRGPMPTPGGAAGFGAPGFGGPGAVGGPPAGGRPMPMPYAPISPGPMGPPMGMPGDLGLYYFTNPLMPPAAPFQGQPVRGQAPPPHSGPR